jgi:hypothetical protein
MLHRSSVAYLFVFLKKNTQYRKRGVSDTHFAKKGPLSILTVFLVFFSVLDIFFKKNEEVVWSVLFLSLSFKIWRKGAPQYFDHFSRIFFRIGYFFFKKNEEVGDRASMQHIKSFEKYLVLCVGLALVRRKHCVSTKARFHA